RRNALFKALVLCPWVLAPAGMALAQQGEPQQRPADATEAVDLDRITVTGRRAADRQAIDDKRYSDSQVDTIRADDVGRLPDQNVAEAVRRLPGVSVSNDQGEGRYLTVRGVSPE